MSSERKSEVLLIVSMKRLKLFHFLYEQMEGQIFMAPYFCRQEEVSFHLTSVRSHKIYFLINLTLYRWCDTLPDNKKWGLKFKKFREEKSRALNNLGEASLTDLRLHISAVSFALSDNSLCLDDNFKVIWHKSNDVTFFLI